MSLESRVEGVLFYRAEPVKKTELAQLFSVSEGALTSALAVLKTSLTDRGITLLETENDVQLVTSPELSETIEAMRKEELRRDIGKAGAETLAIILYRGPLTRSEIDFIRGVNSTFVLRNLLIRGLIERIQNPGDQRSYQYGVTPSLLAHLGITKKNELPGYADVMSKIEQYEKEHTAAPRDDGEQGEPSATV